MPLSLDQSAVDAKEEFQELSVVMSQGSQEGQQQPTFNIIDQTSFQNQPVKDACSLSVISGLFNRVVVFRNHQIAKGNEQLVLNIDLTLTTRPITSRAIVWKKIHHLIPPHRQYHANKYFSGKLQ